MWTAFQHTHSRSARIGIVLDYLSGVPKELDLGFVPSPSGGGLHAVQEEEIHCCYFVLHGYAPDLESPERVECPALVTASGFVQLVFGYPNEEAYWKDPRGEIGHGFFEIEGSKWSRAINNYNIRSFGSPYYPLEKHKHYFIGSKDASCQVLAEDLKAEVFPEHRFEEVVGMIKDRIHDYFRGPR